MSTVVNLSTVRGRSCTSLWEPIRDDNTIPLWLVPGGWTRGQALAHVAEHDEVRFTDLRCRRIWYRWQLGQSANVAGWTYEDGTFVSCDWRDPGAEPFWEVVVR